MNYFLKPFELDEVMEDAQRRNKRKWESSHGGSDWGRFVSSRILGVGSTTSLTTDITKTSSCTDKGRPPDPAPDFDLHLGRQFSFMPPPQPGCDLQLSLSLGHYSSITCTSPAFSQPQETSSTDDGSSLLHFSCANSAKSPLPSACNPLAKCCSFEGCEKGARGASGLCIAHGGGRRCQRPGCGKGAEGRTAFCKAHGGGRRCEFLGCTKSAEGRTDFCIAHGGGRRCGYEGCTKAARGRSGLCIRHGGGKRCQGEGCARSAEGHSGLCISHGGGRRCQFPGCAKGAQGSTIFCKAHGGGKRCATLGCTRGAEGSTPFCKAHGGGKRCQFQGGGVCPKSVHGGTQFCVAHGGGKRCAAAGCTKSARGRTEFCVRHGGGKRCCAEGCTKSAQGRTDFCKAHGGGNRCLWQIPGAAPCDRFARSKSTLCATHAALVQDSCVRGGAAAAQTLKLPEGRVHGGALMAMIAAGQADSELDVNSAQD